MNQGIYITLLIFWIVKGYNTESSLKTCYINANDANSALCQRTQNSTAHCNGNSLSVTSMTMYAVCNCNSVMQCGNDKHNCCSIETNITTPVPDSIKNLYTCTTVQCLNISLEKLPGTGEYYQVLNIVYSCDSKTNHSNESTTTAATRLTSTRRTELPDTFACQTNVSEKNKDEDEAAGFPIAGYIIIPLIIVLVAVGMGLLWRYRRKLFGKKDEESPYIKTGGTGQIFAAAINTTYESSCVTKSTEEHPAYSEENAFDDYSEISTVETSISTNLHTEYNVLNLKNRSVQSDPNYGILSARPVDPDAFYFQIQKQDNGTQGDPYNHIGQTYKVEGGNESTYNSAQFGAQGEHGEEDTYNHIEPTQAEPESPTRCSVEYSKIQPRF